MSVDNPIDRQAGVAIGDFVSDSNPGPAHGDRRDEVHYEPDAGQLTRVSHLVKSAALPPDEVTCDPRAGAATSVQDTGVIPRAPSVWDAAPEDGSCDADRHDD